MKRGWPTHGYTVVELMIVLAVTGALFASAVYFIAGQQAKTEFTTGIRDIESQIQDIMNDTITGYYNSTGNFSCEATAAGPQINAVASEQGTNEDCIFIGRALQFAVGGTNEEGFNVYNIIGLRQTSPGGRPRDVATISEAQPVAMDGEAIDKRTTTFGIKAKKMYYSDGSGAPQTIGAIAFISSLAKINQNSGALQSTSQSLDIYPLEATALGLGESDVVSAIDGLSDASVSNPAGGVVVCFESGSTDQHGLITIGGEGNRTSTRLNIGNGACP